MKHPRITKRLNEELDKLCSAYEVEKPHLFVYIRNHGIRGCFARPSRVYGEPSITILHPDPYERIHTLHHEFVHYLDWLDGVRQPKDEWHDDDFWLRLSEVDDKVAGENFYEITR